MPAPPIPVGAQAAAATCMWAATAWTPLAHDLSMRILGPDASVVKPDGPLCNQSASPIGTQAECSASGSGFRPRGKGADPQACWAVLCVRNLDTIQGSSAFPRQCLSCCRKLQNCKLHTSRDEGATPDLLHHPPYPHTCHAPWASAWAPKSGSPHSSGTRVGTCWLIPSQLPRRARLRSPCVLGGGQVRAHLR